MAELVGAKLPVHEPGFEEGPELAEPIYGFMICAPLGLALLF